jgi:biopolymer transport protein ExbB/TolQ
MPGRPGRDGDAHEVTGILVGASAGVLFGAPGLHGAGIEPDGTPWLAIAIGGLALLLGLGGSQLEKRRGEADIATALQVPVLIAALLALLLCALELGRFGTELWRRRVRARRVDLVELAGRAINDPGHASLYAYSAPGALSAVALAEVANAAQGANRPAETERALARYELSAQRRLDRTRLLVRAGPAIGLMGTLIPLAPGLAALGQGDVGALAENLRDAFGATVVGLLVGTVAFALTLARTRMYSEDLAALEQAAEAPAASSAPAAQGRAFAQDWSGSA